MEALGFQLQQEAVLRTLTEDVVKSSDIEGEKLDPDQVRSSIARRLGIDIGGLGSTDRTVEGVVEMTLDATRNYSEPLTAERLFSWHTLLFPTGRTGPHPIRVGSWRDDGSGPMQVVSGPVGRERVHYEAPPAEKVASEMSAFFDWFNSEKGGPDALLKAALSHFWFVAIHPFDDGNGRIARAIADLALARSEGSSQRFYSMSAQIRRERREYYAILERTQTLDVTPWMEWFMGCLGRSIEASHATLSTALGKARFWQMHGALPANERQRLMINRLLDGFEGKLTTSKWAKLARCSADTALRDITDLVERGVLARNAGGGRSTSYALVAERRG